jgi:uncharacterized protein YceH (UPF0502 family)
VDMNLTLNETRVIGCLIEKEITTPEQYPLSLNALTNACNQKSNREPVLELDETTVQETIDGLIKKHLVTEKGGFGSRVPKYQHRFCNTEFSPLKLSDKELGIVCVLFLRGPQTPGELRTRTNRLCTFKDVEQVESVLRQLMERQDGPFVTRLPREPGKRESRYAHLFSGDVQIEAPARTPDTEPLLRSDQFRLDQLEQLVSELREEVEQLKAQVEQVVSGRKADDGQDE